MVARPGSTLTRDRRRDLELISKGLDNDDVRFPARTGIARLSPTVREVVIIVLGAVYGADYELYAHKSVARTVGLADDHVVALSGGDIPEGLGEHEKLAARLTHALATRHHIDDELYRQAESA